MLLTELQTYSLTHLTNNPFSSATSADNSFAFATEKGLDVLELSPDPKSVSPSLSCRRYVIKPSPALPTEGIGINVGDLLSHLDKENAYSLISDVTVSPRFPRTLPPTPTPRKVAWSPIQILSNQRCVLAVLTDTGSLCLYVLTHHEYTQVGDISALWLKRCQDEWADATVPRTSIKKMEEAKRRAEIVKFTTMCWFGEVEDGAGWLAASTKSGLVTLWRVQSGSSPAANLNILYITQFETEHFNITSLLWTNTSETNSMVTVAGLDGRVSCFALPTPSLIKVVSEPTRHDVWSEIDRIIITHLTCWPWHDGMLLIVIKGAFVIALHLSKLGEKLSYAAYRSCDTSVNGLTQLNDDQMLIVTRSARFTRLTVLQQNCLGKLSFKTDPVVISFNIKHLGCYGINLTQNGVICFILLSVNQSYDHLRLREPTQVLVCSVGGHVDPQAALVAPQRPVAHLWDCLELIRVQVLQKVFVPQFSYPRSVLDTMTIDQLTCTLWFVTFAAAVEDDESKHQDLVTLQKELETLVTSCHFFKRIAVLLSSSTDSLTTFQKLSLSLMHKWLVKLQKLPEEFTTTLITGKTLLQQLDTLDVKLPMEELCDVCGSAVLDTPALLFSECEMGHTLPRCCLSLVQCSQLPYYICAQCGCLAHPLAVEECGIACILCGGVLRVDEDIV